MDSGTELQIRLMFEPVKTKKATLKIGKPGELSSTLSSLITSKSPANTFFVDQSILKLFATATIEMWQRAVHSYLISLSLTNSSDIWASVSGYYSSHYSIRAIAHGHGYFQLFRDKKIVELSIDGKNNVLNISDKGGKREHQLYWAAVNKHSAFSTLPLFPSSNLSAPKISDSSHRERANYTDLLNRFGILEPLSVIKIKERASQIASFDIVGTTIPDYSNFPEIDNVQILAYHRIIKFRNYLDQILGTTNYYWTIERDPVWARNIITYEAIDTSMPDYLSENLKDLFS
jgi:hypothetical protein